MTSSLLSSLTHKTTKLRRPLIVNVNTLMLLLLACISLCILLSVHIHSQLHYHHHDHVPNSNNDLLAHPRHHHSKKSAKTNSNANNANINNKNQGLSACLLVNDENPRLPEWLAYHYHVLPLRSLILTIDPASRSSPAAILDTWQLLDMGLDVTIWEEKDFLPEMDGHGLIEHGACESTSGNVEESRGTHKTDCLWRHRKRQRYFIKKCMAEFKRQNKTWTLLIDVDEYITFNHIEEDDPGVPLDYAPEGIPTLSQWIKTEHSTVDSKTGGTSTVAHVEGTINGLPEEPFRGKKNGDYIKLGPLVTESKDYLQGIHGAAYGNVVEDESGMQYFLQDNHAFRDSVPMASAPGGLPTLRNTYINGTTLFGTIYNGTYFYGKKDGERVKVRTNWRESPVDMKTILGGHLISTTDRKTFYVEREQALWPPHLLSEELMSIRRRLPAVGQGKTILDVLESETEHFGDSAKETIGPCLSMPRLLYGYHEDRSDPSWVNMAPEGFTDDRFVTLRYRWHAIKEAQANKFQKAIVDVSRLHMGSFGGEAENIHVPLKHYCRKDPPRYAVSYFRVNHYMDSFEAYSYRHDARSSKRQCWECYEKKGKEAANGMDDDIRPWLKSFVESVGPEKAKKLLAGAGKFARLS